VTPDEPPIDLGFEEPQSPYESGSQRARVWTEQWAGRWLYCPNCGATINRFAANAPVADFYCSSCSEQFELKAQKGALKKKIVDGAFRTMSQRLIAEDNPNLVVMSYDVARLRVTDVLLVPKHFFVPEIIERRKPLAPTARRAGWEGCNILLNQIPDAGKIFFVREGHTEPKESVLAQWQRTLFLRDQRLEARGWLMETMRCVEDIGRSEFSLDDVYAFEQRLSDLYPNNRHVKQKIRQQLQVLRDKGYLEFTGRGEYRLRN
jgi:type II restriction enzyme